MIRFGLIGTGWRAGFFARVAKALPCFFTITGVYNYSEASCRDFCNKFQLRRIPVLENLFSEDTDFVVNCCSWKVACEYNKRLITSGFPILTETPPMLTEEGLDKLWEAYADSEAKLQVAEQYFLQPYFQALTTIVSNEVIGTPCDLWLSMMHGYHAVCIMRHLLNTEITPCTIQAKMFPQKVIATSGRDGLIHSGGSITTEKTTAILEFPNGTQAYYDFCPEQYFSRIRSRSLRLCGSKGEINGLDVRNITESGEFALRQIQRIDLGQYSNNEGFSLRGLMLGEEYLYKNPFAETVISDEIRLNDEELAIASMLCGMKEYTDTGKEWYPLANAFEDTYISFLINRAAQTGKIQRSKEKAWHNS